MNANRYYIRNTVTGLYWNGPGNISSEPKVSFDAVEVAVIRFTYLNVEAIPA
jgi:hypothetical protein